MRTRSSWCLCVLFWTSVSWAQTPTGENTESTTPSMPSRVVLTPITCTSALSSEVLLRLLQVELAGDQVERIELATPGGENEGALARVSVEIPQCSAENSEYLLSIDDAVTRKSVRRSVDLSDVPAAARPRALALAIAELLRASWMELALPTAPTTRVPVPEAVRDTVRLRISATLPRVRAPREAPRWTPIVGMQLEGRFFPLMNTTVAGARVVGGVTTPWWSDGPRMRWRADAGASYGSGSSLLGDAELLLASAAVAATFGRAGIIGFEAGPRIEVGYVRALGRLTPGRMSSDITVHQGEAAFASFGVLFSLRGRFNGFSPSLEAELGWCAGGVDARSLDHTTGLDVRVVGAGGPSVAIRLGAAWDP